MGNDRVSQGKQNYRARLRRFAEQTGLPIDVKNLWELAELAWVKTYRNIAQQDISIPEKFEAIVDFYHKIQPTFTSRDSTRQIFQQYSTSAPIAWLAGRFTYQNLPPDRTLVFEPSAGNGLLTIFYQPGLVDVNEIDQVRSQNLEGQGYHGISNLDASQPFPAFRHRLYNAILTNPPFGTLGEVNRDYGWGFRKLDHVMVAHALETMRDDGRAAIIIGGHTEFDPKNGLVKSGRPFFDWLFRHYNVIDMVNIDSEKLYAKQGTTFPLRLILVAGRKIKPFGFGPSMRDYQQYADVVSRFSDLYNRVLAARNQAAKPALTLDDIMIRETEKIEMELT